METCKYGSGADKRKPTAVKRKGVVYRAYFYTSLSVFWQRYYNIREGLVLIGYEL